MVGYLEKFKTEMQKILDEKTDKYKDSWEHNGNLSFYTKELRKQIHNLSKVYEKRTLLHIANYCYFMWYHMEKDDHYFDDLKSSRLPEDYKPIREINVRRKDFKHVLKNEVE